MLSFFRGLMPSHTVRYSDEVNSSCQLCVVERENQCTKFLFRCTTVSLSKSVFGATLKIHIFHYLFSRLWSTQRSSTVLLSEQQHGGLAFEAAASDHCLRRSTAGKESEQFYSGISEWTRTATLLLDSVPCL